MELRDGDNSLRQWLSAWPVRPTAAKLSPKVMAVVSAPLVELKEDDPPLLRLKKERFNAALNEAKARVDLYNRGLTRVPELIAVGERLFGAEVDLYDKPEEKA